MIKNTLEEHPCMEIRNFSPVGKFSAFFGVGVVISLAGRDGVVTSIEMKFDKEKGETSTSMTIECFEFEHGLVMEAVMLMPPVKSYSFYDYFTFSDNVNRKRNGMSILPPNEEWEIKKEVDK